MVQWETALDAERAQPECLPGGLREGSALSWHHFRLRKKSQGKHAEPLVPSTHAREASRQDPVGSACTHTLWASAAWPRPPSFFGPLWCAGLAAPGQLLDSSWTAPLHLITTPFNQPQQVALVRRPQWMFRSVSHVTFDF